ncbi:aldose 1-epimerase family protein [Paenibacillus sp. GCM10023252]|uniref:aldose 1-epimerase family protein n=1 Tax=Paenibacillus sp. GCM10023252 TaxID=3252649 RepID=UPI00360D3A93
MQLYGREWTRRELEARLGRLEQIGGIRKYEGTDGRERGMSYIQVNTGAGLSYTVTPTKGLDLSTVSFGGMPISWMSPGGDTHPMYYDPDGVGWLRSASGGMLMTCGLANVGSPSIFRGKPFGLHGRIHHTPARQVCAEGMWNGDEYEMVVRGTVEEGALFDGMLQLRREIRSMLGENKITVADIVDNIGYEAAPHMILYHFNFGFPFMNSNTQLAVPSSSIVPRAADIPLEGYDRFESPTANYSERVYYHSLDPALRHATVKLMQPEFPQGGGRTIPLEVELTWSTDTLPRFVEWKLPAEGSYVLGIEPSNCGVEGIAAEDEKGTLTWLQPGQSVRYSWELNIR